MFSARGVSGLTYRAVASEANVTHGLVSYHFGSREAMVHEALARVAQSSIEEGAILPESGTLEDFARRLPALIHKDPDGAAAQFDLAIQSRRQTALKSEVRDLYAAYIAVCAEALELFGIEADGATARVIFAAIDGLVLQQLIFDEPGETEASLVVLRELIAGLAPRARRAGNQQIR